MMLSNAKLRLAFRRCCSPARIVRGRRCGGSDGVLLGQRREVSEGRALGVDLVIDAFGIARHDRGHAGGELEGDEQVKPAPARRSRREQRPAGRRWEAVGCEV